MEMLGCGSRHRSIKIGRPARKDDATMKTRLMIGAMMGALLMTMAPAKAADEPLAEDADAPRIASVPGDGAGEMVDSLYDTLITVMKQADSVDYGTRHDMLERAIRSHFHVPGMTRIAVGKAWETYAEAERARLVDHFAAITAAKIADQFDRYEGEEFIIVDERAGPINTVWVKTQRHKPDDTPLLLNYLTKKFENGWRIIDIQVMGAFSELANRRSEFKSVIGREGPQALLAALDRKVEAIEDR